MHIFPVFLYQEIFLNTVYPTLLLEGYRNLEFLATIRNCLSHVGYSHAFSVALLLQAFRFSQSVPHFCSSCHLQAASVLGAPVHSQKLHTCKVLPPADTCVFCFSCSLLLKVSAVFVDKYSGHPICHTLPSLACTTSLAADSSTYPPPYILRTATQWMCVHVHANHAMFWGTSYKTYYFKKKYLATSRA